MGLDQFLGDGESKARTFVILGAFRVDPVKTIENMRKFIFMDARPVIFNIDGNPGACTVSP